MQIGRSISGTLLASALAISCLPDCVSTVSTSSTNRGKVPERRDALVSKCGGAKLQPVQWALFAGNEAATGIGDTWCFPLEVLNAEDECLAQSNRAAFENAVSEAGWTLIKRPPFALSGEPNELRADNAFDPSLGPQLVRLGWRGPSMEGLPETVPQEGVLAVTAPGTLVELFQTDTTHAQVERGRDLEEHELAVRTTSDGVVATAVLSTPKNEDIETTVCRLPSGVGSLGTRPGDVQLYLWLWVPSDATTAEVTNVEFSATRLVRSPVPTDPPTIPAPAP